MELIDLRAEMAKDLSDDLGNELAVHNLLDGRLARYADERKAILNVAAFMQDNAHRCACNYFLHAAQSGAHRITLSDMKEVFEPQRAIAHLDATYWNVLLREIGIFDILPEARRNAWHEIIQSARTPPFEKDTILSTLEDLFLQRDKFFAERIDGIFRALSRSHVTNRPEGFSRRMILFLGEYGYYNVGHIHDLRCVIARIRGLRDEPGHYATTYDIRHIPRNGQWHALDGGALRLRLYKKGTAHLEVDETVAATLNSFLALLYPSAIPSKFRQSPKRAAKRQSYLNEILPYPVLSGLREYRFQRGDGKYVSTLWRSGNKDVEAIAQDVLIMLGATIDTQRNVVAFDYDPTDVLRDVCRTGMLPHKKSHQFYPTPHALAQRVVEAAGIMPDHRCLEPSAGTGSLARLMPKDQTQCVEVNRVFCSILEAMGHTTTHADFLVWARKATDRFDRIVMNPPFSEGRWLHHVNAALTLLAPAGRLVAVLPSGAATRLQRVPNVVYSWEGPLHKEFPDASVSVVILTATRTS